MHDFILKILNLHLIRTVNASNAVPQCGTNDILHLIGIVNE